MVKCNIKNKIQLLCTIFLVKYGSLAHEDLEKRFIIDYEKLQFDKNDGCNLIVIPDKPDGTLSYHEYFFIRHDIFDRIKSTHKDKI